MAIGEVLIGRWLIVGIARLGSVGGRDLLDLNQSFVVARAIGAFNFDLGSSGLSLSFFSAIEGGEAELSLIARGIDPLQTIPDDRDPNTQL